MRLYNTDEDRSMEGVCKYDKWRKGLQTDEHRHGLVCMRNYCTYPIFVAVLGRGVSWQGLAKKLCLK